MQSPSHAGARSRARRRLAALALSTTLAACRAPDGGAPEVPPSVLRPTFEAIGYRIRSSFEERDADLVHLSLDLTFEWESRCVHGTATSWVRALRPATRRVSFAAVGIDVREVRDAAGRVLDVQARRDGFDVALAEPLAIGEEEELTVVYRAEPEAGLHFTLAKHDDEEGGDEGAESEPATLAPFAPEIYARGLPHGNRHWIPTLGGLAERTTVDARFHVEHGMDVVASGEHIETVEHGAGRRTHVWRLDKPMPIASLGFVAGRFDSSSDAGARAPIHLHLPRGTDPAAAALTFGVVPRAMQFLADGLGLAYPYPRYDQIVVHGLEVRGLESATASLFDVDVLVRDASELADRSEAPRRTIVHELAHHWFGGHVAPVDDRERWMIEAFATWLELEFEAHLEGREHAAVLWEELREELILGAGGFAVHAEEVPAHYYTKGPWVLRGIAARAGDDGLWRIARALVARCGGGFVATEDLRQVALAELGLELGPYLERWITYGDVPSLGVTVAADDPTAVTVSVVEHGRPFSSPLSVEIVLADGRRERRTLQCGRTEAVLAERTSAPVLDVVVDPDGHLCARFEIEKPASMWIEQASAGSTITSRWRAVEPLVALAAGAEPALLALLRMSVEDPSAAIRRRVLERLSSEDPRVAPVVLRVLEVDPDARVRRAAVRALLHLHARDAFDGRPEVLERLLARHHAESSGAVRRELEALLDVIG